MKKQLLSLQQLISVMDPELYRHLGTLLTLSSISFMLTSFPQRKLMD